MRRCCGRSHPAGKPVTLGGDKNYDTQEFVGDLRGMNITPHVAQNKSNRGSAVDERTTRHPGYEISRQKCKRVEQSFGWMKMIGMLKKVKLRGIDKCWVAVYLRRGSLQSVPVAQPDGRNVTRALDEPAR